eukprot:UN05914
MLLELLSRASSNFGLFALGLENDDELLKILLKRPRCAISDFFILRIGILLNEGRGLDLFF